MSKIIDKKGVRWTNARSKAMYREDWSFANT